MALIAPPPTALSNIVPFIRPPLPLPLPALGAVGAIGLGGVVLGALAVGGLVLGGLLAYAALKSLKSNAVQRTPNTGDKQTFDAPPFVGGQTSGASYSLRVKGELFVVNDGLVRLQNTITGLTGKVTNIEYLPSTSQYSGGNFTNYGVLVRITDSDGARTFTIQALAQGILVGYEAPEGIKITESTLLLNGEADTTPPPLTATRSEPSGYKGGNGDRLEDRQSRTLSPPPAALGVGSPKTGGSPNGDRKNSPAPPSGLGITNNFNTTNNNTTNNNTTNNSNTNNSTTNNSTTNNGNTLGNSTKEPKQLVPPPTKEPLPNPKPEPEKEKLPPPPIRKPEPFPDPKPEKEEKKLPPPPPNPPPNNNNDILSRLAQIIGITSLINTNTQPNAQRLNAKNGSCDALNSPSCTENLKNDIKDPILDKVNQNAGILSGINNFLTASVFPKLEAIQSFSEKVARAARLDKVYNLLTFLTVIHNASMLSNSLATTLMDTLSLGLATVGIKDENESPIDIQSVINSTVENKVKSIIGVENYTVLSDRWKKAVRVYQAAANITYQVRSLWDSAKSLAELTGANVGKIGNALRRDGVVAENAYTAMADNPLMVNNAMTKLQNLEEAASHLNSITSEAYGVTETVTQIKKDQDDFKKLAKESLPLPSIPNDAAKAKDDAAKSVSISPNIANTDLVKP